jgi:cation diffusion facilitator CzcD-associated flavoprotein CzcO
LLIIGAGFAGIGFASRLRDSGFDDFIVLDRGEDVGGTWRDNTYPGCACDVPSHLYSYSFAAGDWSRAFAPQQEIQDYLCRVAVEHNVLDHVRLGVEVLDASWDDDAEHWRVETTDGPFTANVVVSATGLFGAPVVPQLPGIERFAGSAFHSLHWDHDHDFSGQRVAVIGTGASAIQFVPPVAEAAERTTVFQRTPPWVLPKPDVAFPRPVRRILRVRPFERALRAIQYGLFEASGSPSFVDARLGVLTETIGRWWLRREITDEQLREAVTPRYRLGCKRLLFSNNWYAALRRPDVELVTDPVVEVREHAVVTAGGVEHPADVIVYGTGFQVPPGAGALFRGRDGKTVLDRYNERPQSYLGVAHTGFPNLFQFFGPFGAASNQSAVFVLESQYAYVIDALRQMRDGGLSSVEVRPEVQKAFTDDMERRSEGMVWVAGGCRSYYQTADGQSAGLWPGWSFSYRRRVARCDLSDFTVRRHAPVVAVAQ